MARPKKDIAFLTRNNPRWRNFGKWLKAGREGNGIALKAAAKTVKRSERQYARYEKGECSVSRSMVIKLAKAAELPEGRALLRAGYKDSDAGVDPGTELRNVWHYLLQDDLVGAVEIILDLSNIIGVRKRPLAVPKSEPVTYDFVTAVLAIERLPGWLCGDLIEYLKRRQAESEKKGYALLTTEQDKLRKRIEKALSKPVVIGSKIKKKALS